tara:strand:- start:848 stop:1999 length:1152 start_codon:yes stop_codon:yes gene_type:complete
LILTSSYRNIVTDLHDSRISIVQGGTSAGKTYAILQALIIGAYKGSITGLISIVSESLPHLKRGALRDFKKILQDNELYSVSNHNRTDNTYTINDTTFEFFSADQDDKLRGARRDYLFINEANNISYQAWSELFIRTRKWSIIDFNPVSEFWAHTEILGHPEQEFRDKVRFVKLNYKHNEALDQVTIDNIESRKHDPDWWQVYGLGEVGSPTGVIFPPSVWSVSNLPENARYICSGMDFGESNPTTLIDLWRHDYLDYYDEIHYEAGFAFDKLMSVIRADGVRRMIVADPSHETVIRQLGQHGVQIMGVKKYRGSVDGGLAMMKSHPFAVTKRSVNLIKELRNYVYERTKSGILLDTPRKYLDHAIDASRYAKLHSSRAFSIK